MKKAILFDMDGLLVDSETLGIKVAVSVCKDLNFDLTPQEQRSFIGVSDEKFYKELFYNRSLDVDVHSTLEKHFKIYEKLLVSDLESFDGATSLPKTLKEHGYKLAIASGSTAHQIDIILTKFRIKEYFDAIVSCDEITNSKPDPEGYLKAAEKLNERPENCVVLEDAETGIASGKNAGMKVVAVKNAGGQDLSEADEIVQTLVEIEKRLDILD